MAADAQKESRRSQSGKSETDDSWSEQGRPTSDIPRSQSEETDRSVQLFRYVSPYTIVYISIQTDRA